MPKTVYNSSTPIKPNFDPVSKNSSASANCTMNYEKIYPGIYLTSVKDLCAPDDLKIYGFTHIIYIDKHIIARNYGHTNNIGSAHAKNGLQNQSRHSHHQQNRHSDDNNEVDDDDDDDDNEIKDTSVTASTTIRNTAGTSTASNTIGNSMMASTRCNSNGNNPMIDRSLCTSKVQATSSAECSISTMSFEHAHDEMPIDEPSPSTSSLSRSSKEQQHYASNENLFGHSDFATLDLNFGESTYFTANVLPNCYKAVAFIENALKIASVNIKNNNCYRFSHV